jgi:hypothetical protein
LFILVSQLKALKPEHPAVKALSLNVEDIDRDTDRYKSLSKYYKRNRRD